MNKCFGIIKRMKLLVLQHVPHEHPGLLCEFAQRKGIEMSVVKIWEKYTIPDISSFDGLLIMGGPMGVNDPIGTFPSRDDEIALIKETLGKNIPILGICLGSQLLAYALGADIHPNLKSGKHTKEIGYYTIDLTEEGKQSPLFSGLSSRIKILEWHGDTFEIPTGAVRLASSEGCGNQAFSYGNAFGCVFHLEFTPEMVVKQIEEDMEWIHKDFEIDEEKLKEEAKNVASEMKLQCQKFFDNFVGIIKSS